MAPVVEVGQDAKVALERACSHLLSLQDEAGWWKGELQTNVTMDAEDMLLREFLGIRRADESERSAAWIRSQQRADGTWANFHAGPGDLSTTIEAYWALRLIGDPVEAEHMRSAAQFIRENGGIEQARVFTHLWLALFGLWSWERIPALPPEVVLLPSWVPLNVYDFACWARQTIVALSVVIAKRPVHELAFDLRELRGSDETLPAQLASSIQPAPPASSAASPSSPLRTGSSPSPPRSLPSRAGSLPSPPPSSPSRAGRWLTRLDRVLRVYERRPFAPLRRLALGRAERWIVRRQEADGSWGGIQPPWVYSLIALRLLGYPLEHPVMRKGLEGLDAFMIEDGEPQDGARANGARASETRANGARASETRANGARASETPRRAAQRRLEACQSPVWDTALAIVALADAGVAADHPALMRAVQWLLGEEVKVRGDWALARPRLAPGGWAFEFANVNYPDIDDTAEVVLALRRTALAESEQAQGAIARAARWVEGMQSASGGWGAFDADNTRALVRELPFLDFGEVIDTPSADVSAHALEMLAALGLAQEPVAREGLRWLCEQQEADGSWYGRWGVNYVYGTGAAVPALVAAGVERSAPSVRRAVAWLLEHQNEDGGWGEDARSYDDPAWIGRGPSTASQTAWALLALHAAGERGESLRRGLRWLIDTQRPDGGWDEPQYTGTGFPSDYYINYHLYRLTFPIMVLGRCLRDDMT